MGQSRIDALRKTFAKNNIDALLVSNFYNILYLTGFKTLVDNEREAWLLVTQTSQYLFTDYRYSSPIHDIKYITPQKRLGAYLEETVKEYKIKRLGFEADDLKYMEYQAFKKQLKGVNFVETHGLTIKMREIKEGDEVRKIKEACRVTVRCLAEIVKNINIGDTEKEIAFRLEFWLKSKGYDLAFYPIVAVDANSSIPHYDTRAGSNAKVARGSVILIDFGAKYHDYLSDITRMVFAGRPNNEALGQYQDLLDAQTKTLNSLRPGLKLKEVDAFCRTKMKTRGLADYSHSTGHGVGLEIHEHPKMSYMSNDVSAAGQVVTVEPGFYFPGKWGMRIEDTVVVTEKGVETLTGFSKEPLII